MTIDNRLCGFCGTFVDVETKNSCDGKTQTMTCLKCGKKYENVIMDKKTIAPDYLHGSLNDGKRGE